MLRLLRRPCVCLSVLSLLTVSMATAADLPIEGDHAALDRLIAAQKANLTRLPFGTSTVEVHHEQRDGDVLQLTEEYTVEVAWDGPRTRTHIRGQIIDEGLLRRDPNDRPQPRKVSEVDETHVTDGTNQVVFGPRSATISPATSARQRHHSRVSPADLWFGKEDGAGLDWIDMLAPSTPAQLSRIERLVVETPNPDRVILHAHYKNGGKYTVEASMDQGGNVVRYRGDFPSLEQEYERTYTWRNDSKEGWVLSSLQDSKRFGKARLDTSYKVSSIGTTRPAASLLRTDSSSVPPGLPIDNKIR